MSSHAFERLATKHPDLEELANKVFSLIRDQGTDCVIDADRYADFLGMPKHNVFQTLDALAEVNLIQKQKMYVCPNENCEELIQIEEIVLRQENEGSVECLGCNKQLDIETLEKKDIYTFDPSNIEGDIGAMTLNDAEIKRMKGLEDLTQNLMQKISQLEKERDNTADAQQKWSLNQRIQEDREQYLKYDEEYAELAARHPKIDRLPESEALTIINQIQESIQELESKPADKMPDELRNSLDELKEKLDSKKELASANLKVALPIIPRIASLELKCNLGRSMNYIWSKIKNLIAR